MNKTNLDGGWENARTLDPGRAADEPDAADIGDDLEKEHFLLDSRVN